MFGLMKRSPREVYCGTCKSLGTMYGHPTRMLLNHDAVFLAEALLELQGTVSDGAILRPGHCLTMPRELDEIPLALQYAASVTVMLAHFKITDHHEDAREGVVRIGWTLAERLLAPAYRRAAAQLRSWNFPIDAVAAILATQLDREANPRSLADVAEPTKLATSLVFEHGVKLVGREDRTAEARRLGAKFGELIYVLDAYEDRERDARSGAFNPFLVFANRYADVAQMRDEVLAIVEDLEREMPRDLAMRLRRNIEDRLGLSSSLVPGSLLECGQIGGLQPALAFASSATPPPPPGPPPPPPPPRGQFRVARPDPPSRRPTAGGCMDSCKDSCLESIVESICDSVCG